MPLIQLLRHPRERVVHGTVGLVRVSSGWGAYGPGFINPQLIACLRAGQGGGTDRFAGDGSLTPHLVRLIRTFLQGREIMTSTKRGQQPEKGKVLNLIN
jgi:hypothetical protein